MARKPFFRSGMNAWYLWHGGKQVRLHEDHDKAIEKWHKPMTAEDAPQGADRSVGDVSNDFLEWTHANREPSTYAWYCDFLNSFNDSAGTLKVRELKPFHVTRWLARMIHHRPTKAASATS